MQNKSQNKPMKKILFVVDDKKIGGVSSLLTSILNNINIKPNISIDLLILKEEGEMLNNIQEEINIIDSKNRFDFLGTKSIKKLYVSLLIKTNLSKRYIISLRKKVLKDKVYDLEIAFKAGFCSIFTAYGNSKKKINWIHEDYKIDDSTKNYKKTFDKILTLFDKNILVSETSLKSFQTKYPHIKRTLVIPNYVDVEKIINKSHQVSEESKDLVIDENKINMFSFGRACYVKGYDRLIKAVHGLKCAGFSLDDIKIDIVLIGDTKYIKYLKDLKNKLKVNEINIITGRGTKNYYMKIKEYDMYILSSRSESFGLVIVESLILGVPVLATSVSDVSKILGKNKYGITVPNSTKGLEDGIKKIIQNKEILNELKKNVKEFDYNKNNIKIIKEINLLLEV